MRLIDADAMTADLLTVDPQYETMIQWCLTVLDAQPTVDAVRVIRCKDCAYYNVPKGMTDWCDVWGNITREEDFCIHAERRQDDKR